MRPVIIVALLSLLSISLWAPDVRRAFGYPVGMMTATITNGRLNLEPGGGDSSRAALGNTDLKSSSIPMRLRWLRNGACWTINPGEICDAHFFVGGKSAHLALPAVAESPRDSVIVLARVLLALLWLVSAASFVLMRPSPATWAFFALSLYGWSPNNIITMAGPPWVQILTTTFENIWEICIPLAAPLFALYLLQPAEIPRWRRIAARSMYAVIALAAVAMVAITYFAAIAGSSRAVLAFYTVNKSFTIAAIILTLAFFIATYADSDRVTRQRLRWVIAGFAAGSASLLLIYTPLRSSYILYSLFQAVYVFAITAATGYAVLRHRIIDINVVVSRTLVYTLLSAFVVGLFAIVDLFFSRALSQSNAGLMADVGLALVLGFFLNTMHRRIDRFVDGILFRSRHLAEQHVALVADSMRHIVHEDTVNHMLIDEPVHSFDLSFGALARFDRGTLEVSCASENAIVPGTILNESEPLMAYLSAQRKALPLRNHFWQSNGLRVRGIDPSIAVPVFSHGELTGIAFFAAHRNGTELDSDEITLIERVSDAAGAAYDRLEAKNLRELLENGPIPVGAPH